MNKTTTGAPNAGFGVCKMLTIQVIAGRKVPSQADLYLWRRTTIKERASGNSNDEKRHRMTKVFG